MTRKCTICLLGFWIFWTQPLYGQTSWSFSGNIDFAQEKVDVDLFAKGERLLSFQFKKAVSNTYQLDVKVNHLQTAFFDVSTDLSGSAEIVSDESQSIIRGSLESKYTLFNYKPASELSGHFVVKKGRLYFYSLSWSGITGDGYIGLSSPHEIDFSLKFSDAPLADALSLLGCQDQLTRVSGNLLGEINVSGFLSQPYIKGRLSSHEGSLQTLEYDSMVINFEGAHPTLKLEDSMIAQTDGLSFNISGDFNLNAQCDIAAGISALKISPLTAEAPGRREWTIKRKQTEGTESATEFKYRLRKEDAVGGDADLLGVERSIKF